MAAPTLTYTLTNGATADATQVMQNFTDLLNGISDATKDLSINALTVAGTANLNGNINLGNASADDLTITASLASTVPIKTNNSFNIGSATLGLAGLYLGNAGVGLTARVVSASHATARTYTVPDCSGNAGFVMDAALTYTAVPIYSSGMKFASGAEQTALTSYAESTTSTTFTFSGTGSPGTTGSVTVNITRVGKSMILRIPAATAAAGTGSIRMSANTALPSWARPATDSYCLALGRMRDGGSDSATQGVWQIDTSGVLRLYKDSTLSGTFSGTGTSGMGGMHFVIYDIN